MDITVRLHEVRIADAQTGKAYTVKTLRSAQEIAEYVEETEKEILAERVEAAVASAY